MPARCVLLNSLYIQVAPVHESGQPTGTGSGECRGLIHSRGCEPQGRASENALKSVHCSTTRPYKTGPHFVTHVVQRDGPFDVGVLILHALDPLVQLHQLIERLHAEQAFARLQYIITRAVSRFFVSGRGRIKARARCLWINR